jgi:hypothetical protein
MSQTCQSRKWRYKPCKEKAARRRPFNKAENLYVSICFPLPSLHDVVAAILVLIALLNRFNHHRRLDGDYLSALDSINDGDGWHLAKAC